MEQYNKSLKQHVPILIVVLIFLCLVIAGGVTYNAIVLTQTKRLVITTDNDVEHADGDVQENRDSIQSTDQDVQSVEQDVQNINQ